MYSASQDEESVELTALAEGSLPAHVSATDPACLSTVEISGELASENRQELLLTAWVNVIDESEMVLDPHVLTILSYELLVSKVDPVVQGKPRVRTIKECDCLENEQNMLVAGGIQGPSPGPNSPAKLEC